VNNARQTTLDESVKVMPRQRPYRAFAIRAGLGVAVLGLLLWHYDARPALRLLARERLAFFAAAVGLYVAGQVMSSYRWQLLARISGLGGPWREYLTYYFIGLFTNLFVPGLVGGDAARAVYLGRRHHRIGEAVASVMADRGMGLLTLFWFAAACAMLVTAVPLPRGVIGATMTVGLVTLLGFLAMPLLARIAGRLPARLARIVELATPYLRRPVALIPAIVLSLILQASLAVCQYLLAQGLGLNVPLAAFMLCVPIANVFASLPITLNGLGVRETAYLVLFSLAGIGKTDAIALSLLYFAATMLGGLTGVFAFVTTEMP
jgi:glycosyltransferase 2 family protein